MQDAGIFPGLAPEAVPAQSGPLFDAALRLIQSRRNVSPRRLVEPGPTQQQLSAILSAAAAAPDHGSLMPWRFVVAPVSKRHLLAEAFALALIDRDPGATLEQIEAAREKAYRAPFLMLAIVRLGTTEQAVSAAERLVSLGCAVQNVLLAATAAGFGSGLTSGQAISSPRLASFCGLSVGEQLVCCINIGSVTQSRAPRVGPDVSEFVSELP
jgi:nitroreductase